MKHKFKCTAPTRTADGKPYPTVTIEAAGPYEARKMYSRLHNIPVFVVAADRVTEDQSDAETYLR
jgi:hypothetical protein